MGLSSGNRSTEGYGGDQGVSFRDETLVAKKVNISGPWKWRPKGHAARLGQSLEQYSSVAAEVTIFMTKAIIATNYCNRTYVDCSILHEEFIYIR